MLRGARCRLRGLRVELRRADDRDPHRRGGRRRRPRRPDRRALHRALPDRAPAAAGDAPAAGRRAGAADRRARPHRRAVRGLPARGALRLPGHDPRARHDHAPPSRPIVILTSNRTREVHDALKRRCLYHWVDYPELDRELAILRARAPEATETLSPRGRRLRPAAARARICSRSPASPRPSTGRSACVALDAIALARGHRRHAGRAPEVSGRHPADRRARGETHPRRGSRRARRRPDARGFDRACRCRATASSPRTSPISPARCARPACRSGPGGWSTRSAPSRRSGFTDRQDFYWTLHACFVSRPRGPRGLRPGLPPVLARSALSRTA